MGDSKYIISIDKNSGKATLARFNSTETWFCDYETIPCEYENIEVGQEVYSDKYGFTVVNARPMKKVNELIEEYSNYRKELSEKYKFSNNVPSTKKLINKYLASRIEAGKKVNTFVADATFVFCHAMGIKVRVPNGNAYLRKGFAYKEDVIEIIDAIYRYIDEVLMHDTRKNRFNFYLYGIGNMNYSMLKLWIEQNTHFSKDNFTSDNQMRIDACIETEQYEKATRLQEYAVTIEIGPYYLKYFHDGDLLTGSATVITKDARDLNFSWNYTGKGKSYKKK